MGAAFTLLCNDVLARRFFVYSMADKRPAADSDAGKKYRTNVIKQI